MAIRVAIWIGSFRRVSESDSWAPSSGAGLSSLFSLYPTLSCLSLLRTLLRCWGNWQNSPNKNINTSWQAPRRVQLTPQQTTFFYFLWLYFTPQNVTRRYIEKSTNKHQENSCCHSNDKFGCAKRKLREKCSCPKVDLRGFNATFLSRSDFSPNDSLKMSLTSTVQQYLYL